MNESNLRQVLEMQDDFYSQRVGTVYGDYKVIAVWYDWETRKQMWKLECMKCGAIKITHNGRDYRKGKNKGNCECVAEAAKAEKERKRQEWYKNCPDNPNWIGQTIGKWTILEHEANTGWLVKCVDCGRTVYHSPGRIRGEKPVRCMCQFNYGKYDSPEWIGRKYNYLTIKGYVDRYFACVCDCGRETRVKPTNLFDGKVKTCGNKDCEYHYSLNYQADGLSSERLHGIWYGMKARCYNPGSSSYVTYGGRGIGICDEWREDYKAFREWALSHGYADDLSIDRIDNDKGYEPDNCRWVTMAEQQTNKRPPYTYTTQRKPRKRSLRKMKHVWTIGGITKSAIEWCAEYGLSVPMVMYRVKTKGMTPYEALTTPKEAQGRPSKEN
jgi:hypothetical protein